MITDRRTGLYIHIPFCKRKCRYCDFCSFTDWESGDFDRYIEAVLAEASDYRGRVGEISTVFIGGGTPSLLSPSQMDRLLMGLSSACSFSRDCEITAEVNPGTVNADKLRVYRDLGINRLSFGVQSVNENELKSLGRIHTFDDFLSCYRLARDVGFDNVSVDLMYGIPEQTVRSFEKTLRVISELSPEHISCYGLILEEGTPLYARRDSLVFPSEDEECDMYSLACKMLSNSGYEHYEISNYAREGKYCRHNLKYWTDSEYIGLGLTAHSYFDGKRYGNSTDLGQYISLPQSQYSRGNYTEIAPEDERFEYGMLNLRLKWGISLEDYRLRFGVDFTRGREKLIEKYLRLGLADISNGSFFLTERGFYLSNNIMSEIL